MAMNAFAFNTTGGQKLDLFGDSLSYSDEIASGAVAHEILHRNGSLHELTGTPPKKHTFVCLMRGGDVGARYQRLVDVLTSDPTGLLVHPRLKPTQAIFISASAGENPGQELDVINYTLKFEETGLREQPTPSPVSAAASAAREAANTVALATAKAPQALGQAQTLQAGATVFLGAVQSVQSAAVTAQTLTALLGNIATASAALVGNTSLPFPVRGSAALVYAQAQAAYNRVQGGRVAVASHTVQSAISLARLCQQLYPGKAREQEAVIRSLNRIPRPLQIPAGVTLLIPQPAAVAAAS